MRTESVVSVSEWVDANRVLFQMALSELMAEKDDQLLKAWTNKRLVCLGKKKGKVPDRGVLFDRREDYGIGRGPCGGCVLTVGVDV